MIKSGKELLAEQIAAQRAKLLAGARPVSDAELAALQATKAPAAPVPPAPAPITSALPIAAKYAAGVKKGAFGIKLWATDAKAAFQGIRDFVANKWMLLVRRAVRVHRSTGDVLSSAIISGASTLAWLAGQNQGAATISLKELGREAGFKKSSSRLVVRWLEDLGLLRTQNNMIRDEDGQRIYDRNTYYPRMPADTTAEGSPPDPVVTAATPAERAALWVRELAPYFKDLAARVVGFNTTPLSKREKRRAEAHAIARESETLLPA